jgi:hypothetical protein
MPFMLGFAGTSRQRSSGSFPTPAVSARGSETPVNYLRDRFANGSMKPPQRAAGAWPDLDSVDSYAKKPYRPSSSSTEATRW